LQSSASKTPDHVASPASYIRLSSDSRFWSPTLACSIDRTRLALQPRWLQAKGLAFIKQGELASLRSSQEGADWTAGVGWKPRADAPGPPEGMSRMGKGAGKSR
jgi:hypothetical protein